MKRATTKHLCALSAAAALGSAVTGTAVAQEWPVDVVGNIGVTSNYVWRGQTQTNDEAAISGGVDVGHASGVYAGVWTSSLGGEGEYENDYYGGWASSFGDFSVDVGAIYYAFPEKDNDSTEVYGGVGWRFLSATVYTLVDSTNDDAEEDGLYAELNADFPVSGNSSLGLHVGHASGDDYEDADGDAIVDYSVSLSMGDFSLSVSDNTIDGYGNADTFVSWGKEFTL